MSQPRRVHDMMASIHDATFKDVLSSYLYSINLVRDDEEIIELSLGDPDRDGVRPIRFKTIQNREVELIIHS